MDTFSPEQMKSIFTRVMDQMLLAGWLHSHSFTDGKGHHLTWTKAGGQRAALLKRVVSSFGLMDDDRAPIGFDILAHGDRLPDFVRAVKLDADVAAFWSECISELRIRGDADALLGLVHIVHAWAPDDGAVFPIN